ncbi:uncharacterized protein LOC105158608 isoform X2 [Sesamum indicum]|uniref:Uncharacterized protein LOC105158608 isoform X2 n=1 Tax=Sesamum indicum TaxID=4182 RepID=A0A6I9STN2_SESIN|nr:uncharacterized protein LOC105158608 isoform X2 [Sesamum indicum]
MMYAKVKVKEEIEEADECGYEKSSLKTFEWLSLDHFPSSGASQRLVVNSNVPKSSRPSLQASKEKANNKQRVVVAKNHKNGRAASAPRPRAILSSPENDGILWSKTQTRKELLSALKSHNLCQNRHTRCKVFPRSERGVVTQIHNKESFEKKQDIRSKERTTRADSKG